MTKETEVLKLALDLATMHYTDDGYADLRSKVRVATKEALAQAVPDALHFAQWAAAKKDLSDYICVGSLTLAGIEDGEYGQSEINSFENTIEALQERLVTGSEHKKVPLVAYIGALNSTPPAPLPVQEPDLTEQASKEKKPCT